MSSPTIARHQYSVLDHERYFATLHLPFQDFPVVDAEAWDCLEIAAELIPKLSAHTGYVDFMRIFTDDDEFSGAFLYTWEGEPQICFKSALLGYDGSGPDLSRAILEDLQVPGNRFEAINDAARNLHGGYAIRLLLR